MSEKSKAERLFFNLIYEIYMWLWVRPSQLVELIRRPEFYTSPTYYPEYPERLRSHWSQFWNQVGQVLKYGRINTLYYLCGYDVKTAKEQKEYVHYSEYMHRREMLKQSNESNCACILRDKLYFSIFTEGIGLREANTLFYTLDGDLYDFRTKTKTTAAKTVQMTKLTTTKKKKPRKKKTAKRTNPEIKAKTKTPRKKGKNKKIRKKSVKNIWTN